jgi:hypothetical protein
MNALREWLAAGLVLAAGVSIASAQSPLAERARQQQQVQKEVRDMARNLIGEVLDKQIQQLRENGLTKHPWYAEIAGMRKNLDRMVEQMMPEVIALLAKVDPEKPADREKAFELARQKSREIVIRLLVERQALLRRLKIAEMAAQVQQLIVLQEEVL